MKTADVDAIVRAVADWALHREDVRAMAIVGSWARGDPHQGSDVDLLLLSDRADEYRHRQKWLAEIDLESAGFRIASSEDASYGVVWVVPHCLVARRNGGIDVCTALVGQSRYGRRRNAARCQRCVSDRFR
jgi:predicted nucleotidyltransferase